MTLNIKKQPQKGASMKVTIITVAYNSGKTIADAIESVLAQTYPDIEHWIIDGGSTDETLQVIRRYEQRAHGRLHWISEKDKGIYDAMNKGIARSTGDVIGILNSDDFFTSNDVIERMVAAFEQVPDTDIVYGDVHFVKKDDLGKCVRYYSGRIFTPALIRFGYIAPHTSFYIRREVFEKYGVYDPNYRISADFELIARFCHIHRLKRQYLHLDFVTMRMGGASTRNLRARMLGTKEDLRACKKIGIYSNWAMICCKFFIKGASTLFIRK